ncbi:TPA: hypothetical protein ACQUHH_003070 [Bacillus mobilis]
MVLNEKVTFKYCIGPKYNWEITSGLVAKSLFKKACSCSADIDVWS